VTSCGAPAAAVALKSSSVARWSVCMHRCSPLKRRLRQTCFANVLRAKKIPCYDGDLSSCPATLMGSSSNSCLSATFPARLAVTMV
jgi:hypothetical protein